MSTTSSLDDSFLTHFRSFTAGAVAACLAVSFTNPFEIAKVRMQLQGELSQANSRRIYKNAFDCIYSVFKNEGLQGLQRGLVPAYFYQIILNGFRLGMYEPIKGSIQLGCDRIFHNNTPKVLPMVLSGFTSGVLGAFMANPFFLIKTRMQSFTKGSISVGHQHQYVEKGVAHSLRYIFNNEGVRGLFRGVDASMLRTGVGSAVQLPSYDIIKYNMALTGFFDTSGAPLHFAASLATSFLVCLAMNPFDVLMTRMYNQKDSKIYNNVFDCMVKTLRAEGPVAFYKGFMAHYLRIG